MAEPAGPRILVISSHEQAMLRSVEALRADLPGAAVVACPSLVHGRDAVTRWRPDVVFLLERSESLEPCLEFCHWLREANTDASPSLVLVYPSKDVSDWKRVYDAQGDMFIAWDGNFIDGLASCVRSLVGRRYRMVNAPLEAGALQLFPEGLIARIGGRLVSFTPMEFRIVRHLVENAGRVVTRAELAQVLADDQPPRTRGRRLEGLLYQFISQIRKKLAPDDKVIRNVRGVGYRIDLGYEPD